jgi:hypothetical protein
MRSHLLWGSVLVLGLVMTACERKASSKERVREEAASVERITLPPDLFVDQAPAGARGVGALRADASANGRVVLQGRIGGRVEPFVDGAAVFLLADKSMKACNELPGDGCPTPWDYCCEPRDSLAAKTATVQVVDADGKPLRVGLEGRNGLKPAAELTIAGEVAQRESGSLVINARKIYVKPSDG